MEAARPFKLEARTSKLLNVGVLQTCDRQSLPSTPIPQPPLNRGMRYRQALPRTISQSSYPRFISVYMSDHRSRTSDTCSRDPGGHIPPQWRSCTPLVRTDLSSPMVSGVDRLVFRLMPWQAV
ncbi:hypothetical protein GLOTRDRAFT_117937 [Gloeophyllum trabeum ATCC 11539]|uniref:Uncharacterized protein n=1 Tax=Gloeophyllum trabeum (strain ATCC 11539 / FP-39264 / Madison 617) TaxID=670483 RepID=S7PW92_GLOTA|nr:uncharacterized protein GLOTRDRAFT_117937 [Gloeophyllum trabeum ATCC 11539]EPQ51587.1 hypothetical protein GLOTRDRAFT_117937 [Gloeophyllum trabeum ATCC 11539]